MENAVSLDVAPYLRGLNSLVCLIPKSHNRIRTCYLAESASEHFSTCHKHKFLHNMVNVLVQIANKMGL
jgi:hypothetical protein